MIEKQEEIGICTLLDIMYNLTKAEINNLNKLHTKTKESLIKKGLLEIKKDDYNRVALTKKGKKIYEMLEDCNPIPLPRLISLKKIKIKEPPLNDGNLIETLDDIVSKDENRHNIKYVFSDGENIVATDGFKLIMIGKELPEGFYNVKTGLKVNSNYNFPDYKQIIPKIEENPVCTIIVNKLYPLTKKVSELLKKIGYISEIRKKVFRITDLLLSGFDIILLNDIIATSYKLGIKELKGYRSFKYASKTKVLTLIGTYNKNKVTFLLMPTIIDDIPVTELPGII